MAKRVFVHIGTMKSGTTYLQSWLDRNEQRLADQGLFWNRSDRNFRATDDLFHSRKIRPGLDGAWPTLKARLDSHPGDALISNELLAAIAPKKAARLVAELRPAEVHLMVTARDLVKVVPSQWQTAMRNRSTVTWAQYVDDICTDKARVDSYHKWFWNRQDIAGIVKTWSKLVPLDRFSIITVPPSGTPPTVLGDRFLSVLSVEGTGFEAASMANASLGAHSGELLRRLNAEITDFDWPHHQWAVKNGLARRVLEGRAKSEPKIGLTQSQHDEVRVAAVAMVERLRGMNLTVVGSLDDLIPGSEAYGDPTDPGDATDGELLEAAIDGLAGMGKLLADQRIDFDEMTALAAVLVAREEQRSAADSGDLAPEPMSSGEALRHKGALIGRMQNLVESDEEPRKRRGLRQRLPRSRAS